MLGGIDVCSDSYYAKFYTVITVLAFPASAVLFFCSFIIHWCVTNTLTFIDKMPSVQFLFLERVV